MKQLVFIIFAFCVISNSYAQMDCESIPSCEELGYTQESCSGGKGVRCPFDENKFYCAGVKQLPDAPEPVVTPEDWSAECADKIAYCTAYNTDCKCTACQSGYLLSDGDCVPECDKSADTCATESKIFNAETCSCEACPTNYQFNSETKACEQIACDKTKVEHCTTYSSDYEPCTCQACETNYLLVDGVCKKMCTVVDNCKTYDSEYDPCNCTACEDGFTLSNGKCVSDCAEKCKIAYPLFAGQDNTKAVIDQIGAKEAVLANAANQFYVGDEDGDFGKGKWYLPSIGEVMYAYGVDMTQVTEAEGASGGSNDLVTPAINTLIQRKADIEIPAGGGTLSINMMGLEREYPIATSSENSATVVFRVHTPSGSYPYCDGIFTREVAYKYGTSGYARPSLILQNIFDGAGEAPKVGDVMYTDKTYGAASEYDGSKTPAGIIYAVSMDKKDVSIISLTFLTSSSRWTSPRYSETDIIGIPNITAGEFVGMAQASGNCPCHLYKPDETTDVCPLSPNCCKFSYNKRNSLTGGFETVTENVTCYKNCQEVNSDYINKDDIQENYSCSETTIYLGSGYAGAATKETCYYNCECGLTVATCAAEGKAFNSDTCACEDCPSGYLFDSEVNECREACKGEWQCDEEDSLYNPCNCIKCNMGTYLSIDWRSSKKGAFTCSSNAQDLGCQVDYCLACDVTNSVCVACAGNRILKDNKCVLRENKCSHGTIIYDDLQCYKEDQVPSGRVPIGIVINSTNGYKKPGKLKILSLDSVDLPWSENLATTKTGCNSRTDGKANTDCIIAAGAEEDSAAVYCNNYGVMDDDKGKWFLPSIQEVLILGPVTPDYFYEVEEDGEFLNNALNTALNSLGNSTESRIGDNNGLLSSTEYSDTQAIYSNVLSSLNLNWDNSSRHFKASKTKKMRVRCVREFEDAPTIGHCNNYTRYGCRFCDSGYMPSEDGASCIQASCSEIEDCEKYDPTTCRCALCSPRTGSYLSSDGFTCFRPIPYCEDQKDGVCEACKSGYALSDDKLSCIAQ